MKLVKSKPTTPGLRHKLSIRHKLSANRPQKNLRRINKKTSGRNSSGKITIRHRGGRQKRFLRLLDFKRIHKDIPAKVVSLEYDPNRTAHIALLHYQNGDKQYILAPKGVKVGDMLINSEKAEIEPGNSLPLRLIPVGTPIHNIEFRPQKGGQIVRSAGAAAFIQSKDGDIVTVKLPSNETRIFNADCWATVGQISNVDHKNQKLGKAGRRRLMGWRPSVRGTAQHPASHPHGGGEGRSGIGMPSPKSPWGKHTLGKKTRRPKKYSDKLIIKDRRKKN